MDGIFLGSENIRVHYCFGLLRLGILYASLDANVSRYNVPGASYLVEESAQTVAAEGLMVTIFEVSYLHISRFSRRLSQRRPQ